MATSWYKNYLAADVQPWARQLQKEIDNLKSNFQSAEVNNTTRDDQLASSLRQVQSAANNATDAAADAAVAAQDALDAINGLTGLGSPGSTYEVDGTNIVANTITANEINSSYIYTNTLDASQITAGSLSADFISGGTIDASDITGVNISGVNVSGSTVSGGNVSGASITGGTIYGTDIEAATFTSGGLVDCSQINTGICYISQDLQALVNTSVAGNTTTSFNGNLFINSSGTMFRNPTISSVEAKENITPFEFNTQRFIAISPVEFNYKREAVLTDEEASANSLGFILEDFEAAGLGEHLVIPANEIDQYKGLRYDKLYMFLHKVVQEQQAKIAELEARITTLEG